MKPLLSALDRAFLRDGAMLIAGNLGAGKSYTAVRVGLEWAAIKQRPYYANFPIRYGVAKTALRMVFGRQVAAGVEIGQFSMLDEGSIRAIPAYPKDSRGAVVVLDEVLLYHQAVEAILDDIVVQARKRRWLLLLLAQSPDALPRKYRMITAQYLRTTYLPGLALFGLHLVDRRIQTNRSDRQIMMRRWHKRQQIWSLAYDSWYEFPTP